jgi:hypothetical protein
MLGDKEKQAVVAGTTLNQQAQERSLNSYGGDTKKLGWFVSISGDDITGRWLRAMITSQRHADRVATES